jgi:hypothetical protein
MNLGREKEGHRGRETGPSAAARFTRERRREGELETDGAVEGASGAPPSVTEGVTQQQGAGRYVASQGWAADSEAPAGRIGPSFHCPLGYGSSWASRLGSVASPAQVRTCHGATVTVLANPSWPGPGSGWEAKSGDVGWPSRNRAGPANAVRGCGQDPLRDAAFIATVHAGNLATWWRQARAVSGSAMDPKREAAGSIWNPD